MVLPLVPFKERAILEFFGQYMIAAATPRLDASQTPQQTAEANAFDWGIDPSFVYVTTGKQKIFNIINRPL